jgi:pantoate--beta-alanine ligase
MGALHEGHLSLISESKKTSGVTVCSIFINPAQFNNKDDFEKYPCQPEQDILLLEESGCDILFMPGENEIYRDEASKRKHFNIGYLEEVLEGKYRPGHFQGVCLVVEKLLEIVEPDQLYLGQKDYQQCLVIRKLIELMNKDIEVIICPIVREENGLAMSSRNLRLTEPEKNTASELYTTIKNIAANLAPGNFAALKKSAWTHLENNGFKMDYLDLAKQQDLEIVSDCDHEKNLIILVAAFLNNVRLIDNTLATGVC